MTMKAYATAVLETLLFALLIVSSAWLVLVANKENLFLAVFAFCISGKTVIQLGAHVCKDPTMVEDVEFRRMAESA